MDSDPRPVDKPSALLEFIAHPLSWYHCRCMPFVLLLAAMSYGLLIALYTEPGSQASIPTSELPVKSTGTVRLLETEYRTTSLQQVLDEQLWRDSGWQPITAGYTGIGYLDTPATFRITVENPTMKTIQRWAVVDAPYLNRIRPAILDPDGHITLLPGMGDVYPSHNRIIDLPQWIWPITLPPGTSTLLFEVSSTGPTLLPLSIMTPRTAISSGTKVFAWAMVITGILIFALLFNLSMVVRLKRPGLAWLSVLMFCIIHAQLVMNGFGLWYLWPNLPEINALLNISLPLILISLCQFTPHYMTISKASRRALNIVSLLATFYLLIIPAALPMLGQGSFLLLAPAGSLVLLGVVLAHFKSHVYARYYALSLLAMLIGGLVSILRTVGWAPINSLTDSAFFLGSAIAALVLTSGVGRQILNERKKRIHSDTRARREGQLRARIEQDYNYLLKTHRISGMPNRSMLEESLNRLDSRQQLFTVVFLQLKRFGEIEQALGYRMAEDLLKNYLKQLNNFLKRSLNERLIMIDGHALASIDTVNHAFAFYRSDHSATNEPLPNELIHWLGKQYKEGRFSFSWGVSIGIAHAPEHGLDTADILSAASVAASDNLYPLTVYDTATAEWQYQQQMLMLDVEKALPSGEIWLEYQPKVSIRDTQIHSFEALIRWQHPDFGNVPPDHWIPLAEQVGMIHLVTLWVIERGCRDFARLRSLHGDAIKIAINVSAADLAFPAFCEEITTILGRYAMSPADLILEITETAMMADTAAARDMISRLSQRGFRIALDDFGTGHSSLATLATFEIDELKIDRSFLQDILLYPARQRIFRAALELGEALDLDVVVEGVENEAIAIWLQQFPGLHGQGYYWGRPARIDTGS